MRSRRQMPKAKHEQHNVPATLCTQVVSSRTKSNRILELDGLRAFAVIVVIFHHMACYAKCLWVPAGRLMSIAETVGTNGVSVFFVISGFIITSLLIRENEQSGSVSLSAFYARRFFRIVPPFAVYALTIFTLSSAGLVVAGSRALLAATFFLGDTGLVNEWLIGHTWNLSVEEQFYILFPLLLCVWLGCSKRPAIFAVAVMFAFSLFSLKIARELGERFDSSLFQVATLYHFRYILAGVMFALVDVSFYKRLQLWPTVNALVPIVTALLIIVGPHTRLATFGSGLPFGAAEPIACAIFVLWFANNPERSGLLRIPAVQWLGACSYSVYLWQQLFTGPPQNYHGWNLAPSPTSIFPILGCAVASYYLVERPSMRLGHQVSDRLRQRARGNAHSTSSLGTTESV